LASIAIPDFVRTRTASQQNGCINNLRLIDAAKQQWALDTGQKSTAVPVDTNLQPYAARGTAGELPYCPAGASRVFDTRHSPESV
jgi:hypothetical protein